MQLLLESPSTAFNEDAPEDGEDESAASRWPGKSALEKIVQFCRLHTKSDMVKAFLCEGAFDGAGKQRCIYGECLHCGFKKLWSNGLRKYVVDSRGNVINTAPVQSQSIVRWVRIKSSKDKLPDEGKDTRYDARQGTVVQFLEEFERETSLKFPHHRFTIQRQKLMDAEFTAATDGLGGSYSMLILPWMAQSRL